MNTPSATIPIRRCHYNGRDGWFHGVFQSGIRLDTWVSYPVAIVEIDGELMEAQLHMVKLLDPPWFVELRVNA